MTESVGMMSGAYFVGKNELLNWLNDTFGIGYTKVEQCCSGAIHCQIMDAIYPGEVPLHKVNFAAKYDHEYVNNYKILQKIFDKKNIRQHVDVIKLTKGKYQDNLEFLQWIYNYFQRHFGGQEYDGKGRREAAWARYNKGKKHVPMGDSPGMSKPPAAAKKPAAAAAAAKPSGMRRRPPSAAAAAPGRKPSPGQSRRPAAAAASGDGDPQMQAKVSELTERLAKLRLTIEGLEKERNFYFGKLREIEVLCQTDEDQDAETKAKVLEILYHTGDNDEFEQPEEADAPEEEPAEEEEEEEVEQEEEQEDEEDELTY